MLSIATPEAVILVSERSLVVPALILVLRRESTKVWGIHAESEDVVSYVDSRCPVTPENPVVFFAHSASNPLPPSYAWGSLMCVQSSLHRPPCSLPLAPPNLPDTFPQNTISPIPNSSSTTIHTFRTGTGTGTGTDRWPEPRATPSIRFNAKGIQWPRAYPRQLSRGDGLCESGSG